MTVVLDSWVVLRYLEDTEPAASAVADLLEREKPLMSWINLGGVHYVHRRFHGEDDAAETVRDLRDVIDVRVPDERLVLDAARVKADHPMAVARPPARAFLSTAYHPVLPCMTRGVPGNRAGLWKRGAACPARTGWRSPSSPAAQPRP